jgi:Ca-activated chloride channel family protein
VRIDVTWREVLGREGGLLRWSLPLAQAGLLGRAPEQVVLDMRIETERPLSNVFSPMSSVDVLRTGERTARVSFEATRAELPAHDLEVFFGDGAEEFGLDVVCSRDEGSDEGTLMLLASPRLQSNDTPLLPKTISVVIDRSGSMRGEKFEQAKRALLYFLDTLRPEDHFNVIPFSSGADPFFRSPAAATEANLESARKHVRRLTPGGGTNMASALKTALGGTPHEGSIPLVIFLTDGLPTVGARTPKDLIALAEAANTERARLFVLGVGYEVNIPLLDILAEKNNGTRAYVRAGEAIEVAASDLVRKISRPVMSDVEIEIDGIVLERAVPSRLPDLFDGGRVELFARYVGTGIHEVRLSGMYGGERTTFVFEADFSAEDSLDFVPSLWAERRIAVLLDEMRLYGTADELYAEVVNLGREYGIVTPYTAHLALEPGARTGSGWFLGSGPASPGSAAPMAPGSPAGGRKPTTGGGGSARSDLGGLVATLRDAGVLRHDASDAELEALALTIAAEMRAAATALEGLGKNETGKGAVDDSTYLADMLHGARRSTSSASAILALFSRRIGTRHFDLRAGKWVDRDFDEKTMAARVERLKAFSDGYFGLLGANSKLGPVLALSDRMVIVIGERVVEIVPAPADSGAEGEDVADVDEAGGREVEAEPDGK